MTKINFSIENQLPCLNFEVEGEFLTWQDWMTDSLNLLSAVNFKQTSELAMISFQTGANLANIGLFADDLNILLESDYHLFACSSVGKKSFYEGLMVKKSPIERTGCFLQGIEAQASGEIEKAIEVYSGVVANSPNMPRVNNLLGLCHRINKDFASAEKAYQAAISISPEQAEAYSNLGILYLKAGQEDEAMRLFSKALERDQFYLNALLQYSKIMSTRSDAHPQLVSSLNLRLVSGYSDLSIVQEHLGQVAQKLNLPLHTYIAKLKSENGFMSDQKTMLLLKRTENLRINGAIFAALHGFQLLLSKTAKTPAHNFIESWVASRLKMINSFVPSSLQSEWLNKTNTLTEQFPTLKSYFGQEKQKPISSPLTTEEFYTQVVFEMLRDGQIHPNQAKFLTNLRGLLKLSEEKVHEIMQTVAKHSASSPMQDREDVAFNPKRLFGNLVRAVFRDGKVDDAEKKILVFASKAFGLSSEEVNQIVAEAKNGTK